MAIQVSISSNVKGEKLDIDIYEITPAEVDFIESQGVCVYAFFSPHVIEVVRCGKFERLVVDESEVLEVMRGLITKGELLEEFEMCHELLKIQKIIEND